MIAEYSKQIRGPYICYATGREFSTAHALRLKATISDDLKDCRNDIALDLRELRYVDQGGYKFLKNLDETLVKGGRQLVLFGAVAEVQRELEAIHKFISFATLVDFERGFHEINPNLQKTILSLAQGKGSFRTLKLACPLCGCEEVAGYVIDESRYVQVWTDDEIVPVHEGVDDAAEEIDFSVYQVAVCPVCYFAASRPDWFRICFPEGDVPSVLKPEQIDNLSNSAAGRRNLGTSCEEAREKSFFRMPREHKAALMSWKLNEFTHRHISADRKNNDGFEIALSNFMICKFTDDVREVDERLHTAMAWLNTILLNRSLYSTLRIAKTYTFAISALLALDKSREARALYDDFFKDFRAETDCEFWLFRAKELLMEDMDQGTASS